jgi:hypothetical protein
MTNLIKKYDEVKNIQENAEGRNSEGFAWAPAVMNSSISKKCIFFLIVPLLSVGETAGQE